MGLLIRPPVATTLVTRESKFNPNSLYARHAAILLAPVGDKLIDLTDDLEVTTEGSDGTENLIVQDILGAGWQQTNNNEDTYTYLDKEITFTDPTLWGNRDLVMWCWYSSSDGNGPVMSWRDRSSGTPIVGLYLSFNGLNTVGTGTLNPIIRMDALAEPPNGVVSLDDGRPHCIALTRQKTSWRTYIDGVQQSTFTNSTNGDVPIDVLGVLCDWNWASTSAFAGVTNVVQGTFYCGGVLVGTGTNAAVQYLFNPQTRFELFQAPSKNRIFTFAEAAAGAVLSAPNMNDVGSTKAEGCVTTDTAGGVLYGYINQSSTPPSDANHRDGTSADAWETIP